MAEVGNLDANKNNIVDQTEKAQVASNAELFAGLSQDKYCKKDGKDCPPEKTFTKCEERTASNTYYASALCKDDETFVDGGCSILGNDEFLRSFGPIFDKDKNKLKGYFCNIRLRDATVSAKAICCK